MNKLLRLIFLVIIAALGFWAWTILFPNPQAVVRSRLNKVAKLASFTSNEGNLARAFDVKKLGAMFSDDAQLFVNVPDLEPRVFTRDEMTQALMAAKRIGNGMHVEFVGVNIELGSGADSALADLTMKAKIAGQNDLIVQEMKFTLKKIKGDWLITRVETVNTLKP